MTQDTSPIIGGMNARIKALEEKLITWKVGKNMNKVFVYGTLKSGVVLEIRKLWRWCYCGQSKDNISDYTMVDLVLPVLSGTQTHTR